MARETEEAVEEPEEEEIGESSQSTARKSTTHGGTHIFTMDDFPPSKWARRFQEFQAWMTTKNLSEDNHFEILFEFTARHTSVVKDWWKTLGEPDKLHFLTRQEFSENIELLHRVFLGDVITDKEAKHKEFFQMKYYSYNRKDLDKHFDKMIQLFFTLGVEVSLKQTF